MKTILLVEDESDLRFIIKTTLEDPRFRILEADNGEKALKIAQEENVDLFILDWMIPGITGVAVAERLKKDPATAEVPIIMVTARSQPADRDKGRAIGAFAYLVKPFSPLELLSVVEEALG